MKTAISIADSLFERVKAFAKKLGRSRSESFATAAGRHADEVDDSEFTAAIDASLAAADDDDSQFVRKAAEGTFDRGAV